MPPHFSGASFTTGLGLFIAMLGFTLIFPDTERFARRQLLTGVSSALSALLGGRSSMDRFTTSVFDLLNDFGADLSDSNERDRRLLEGGFGLISIGIELRRLHERLALGLSARLPADDPGALNDAARQLCISPTPAALDRTIALATAGAELARARTASDPVAADDRGALASFTAVADLCAVMAISSSVGTCPPSDRPGASGSLMVRELALGGLLVPCLIGFA